MEKYYVLEKFALWKTTALSALEAMQIKRKAIAKNMQAKNNMRAREIYQELEFVRNKVMDALMNLKLLFCEAQMDDCAEYAGKLYKAVKGFNLMTSDYTGFIKSFVPIINQIPNNETTNSAVIGRLMNNVRTGYYPTDLQHVRKIKESIVFPEGRRINALDTCCGCGLALEELTRGEIADTYGIEIDELRGHEAEQRLDRVGFGSFFYSRMSRDAFHLLFLNPPYISVMKEGGGNTRAEKKFLVDSIYHLMDGGVLVYIIPYYRLTSDICRILCDNFSDLRVYRFAESEFKKFRQVAVMGVKKPKADGSELVEGLMQRVSDADSIPPIQTLPAESYVLPAQEKKVELFKGAKFNLGELQRQLEGSKSLDGLFEKSSLDAREKRPLLPLNVGQVGLIGGSGLINGYVDCENPHILKGRIIKEMKKTDGADGTLVETRVNKMVFNVLTPYGFKKLA